MSQIHSGNVAAQRWSDDPGPVDAPGSRTPGRTSTRWSKRDLSANYFWVDGIHAQARLEDDAQCLLVIIGATPEGKKELVGLIDGLRRRADRRRTRLHV
jgi:hypothetical protein